MNNFSRAVPKPIRDTSPDPCEIVLKARAGSEGALMALVNTLKGAGKVSQGQKVNRANGEVDQTLTLTVYKVAKHYEPTPERPYIDRAGIVYLVYGVFSARHKVGETNDIRRRILELNSEFKDDFKVVHLITCTDRFAKEQWIHKELKQRYRWTEREFFLLSDEDIEWFISLQNE